MIPELNAAIEKSDSQGVHIALLKNFEFIKVELRNEAFFCYHYRCCNQNKEPFFVRFGWSESQQRWIFEALYDD